MLKFWSIWLQKSALIQPRTSLSKFADAYKHHPPPGISSALCDPSALRGGWRARRRSPGFQHVLAPQPRQPSPRRLHMHPCVLCECTRSVHVHEFNVQSYCPQCTKQLRRVRSRLYQRKVQVYSKNILYRSQLAEIGILHTFQTLSIVRCS